MINVEPEVGEGCRLACGGHGSLFAAYDDGGAPPVVACSYDAVLCKYEEGAGSGNCLVDVLNALNKIPALDNEQTDELCRVYSS